MHLRNYVFCILCGLSIFGISNSAPTEHEECDAFYNALSRFLDFYEGVFDADRRQEQRQWLQNSGFDYLGINIFDAVQLKRLSCAILEAKSVSEIKSSLGSMTKEMDIQFYYDRLDGFLDKTARETQTLLYELYEAKGWAQATGYPDFPIEISYANALRSLNNMDVEVARTLGIQLYFDRGNVEVVAKALTESKSLDEFVKMVGVDPFEQSIDEKLRFFNQIDNIKGVYEAYQDIFGIARRAGLLNLPYK